MHDRLVPFIILCGLLALPGGPGAETLTDREKRADDHQKDLLGKSPTPVDLAEAALAVESYVYQKPPSADELRVYDRMEGKVVTLKLEEVDLERVRRLRNGNVALTARFQDGDGTPYQLVFAVGENAPTETVFHHGLRTQVEALDQLLVKDVVIVRSGDRQRFVWKRNGADWELQRKDAASRGDG
jgi:hypothetical protein